MPPKRRRGRVYRSMRHTGPTTCADCQARIVYVRMDATGKRVPVDPIPDDQGTVCARLVGNQLHGYVISAQHPHERPYTRYVAHFGTCADRPRPAPKPEPAPTLFDDPEPDTCRPVEVDGEIIRVHGGREMDETDRAMFAEIVRAAKRRMESEPQPDAHTVTIGERSTTHLRTLCRPQICGQEPQRGGDS